MANAAGRDEEANLDEGERGVGRATVTSARADGMRVVTSSEFVERVMRKSIRGALVATTNVETTSDDVQPDLARGRFNNDARARADAAVMSHVAAVRELDDAVAAALECEHAVWALKKAVADAKGAHRTSAFASEAVTARGAAKELVAMARRVDAALTAAVVENLSAVRRGPGGSASRARPSPSSPSPTAGRRRPASAPRSPRFDVATDPTRYALQRDLAELDHRETIARLTAVPVTTVRLRLTRFRPPATRGAPRPWSPSSAAISQTVVPFHFRRAAAPPPGDPDGADALAALLPDMRAKLQLEHVGVVGVYGADGARRASVYDLVDGETVALKTVADVDAAADDDADDAFARLGRGGKTLTLNSGSARALATITVRAVPTSATTVASRGAGVVSVSSSPEDAPVSVRLPAAFQTPKGALDAVAKAVLASRRSLAPPLALYVADGSPVEDVPAQIRDGDVVLYRCAHHPAPATATAARKQRKLDATLATPKEVNVHSFAVVAKMRRRKGTASGAGAGASAGAERDRERELRLPSRGLEAMSMATLRRRIALAFGVEDPDAIERVRLAPGRVELEHPAQLHPGARVTFETREPAPGKPSKRRDEHGNATTNSNSRSTTTTTTKVAAAARKGKGQGKGKGAMDAGANVGTRAALIDAAFASSSVAKAAAAALSASPRRHRVASRPLGDSRVTARDLRPARPASAPPRPGVGEVGFGARIRFDPALLKSASSPVKTRPSYKTQRRRKTAPEAKKTTSARGRADGTTGHGNGKGEGQGEAPPAGTFYAFRDVPDAMESADALAATVGASMRLDASPLPEKDVVDEHDDERDVGRYLA